MSRPSKPMAKNSNSRFTTRNNKQDIFSGFTKSSRPKVESDKRTTESTESRVDNPNP